MASAPFLDDIKALRELLPAVGEESYVVCVSIDMETAGFEFLEERL